MPHPCMIRGMSRMHSPINIPARSGMQCVRGPRMPAHVRTGEHCRAPTDPCANEHAPPSVHFDDYARSCYRAGMSVRAFVTWVGGGLTARHSVDSMRRHKVTGAERTSDASSASGASTCASKSMRQRIPAQCARGGPATPADGYYSVLCGNCTGTVPNS